MRSIRLASVVVVSVLVFVFVIGCGLLSGKSQEIISIEGSTSMEKVIGYLSEAYMEDNSNVNIAYNPTGSSSGIQAVLDGRCDIGLSSRNLNAEEEKNLIATAVAIDGIAIVVNDNNPISNLSMDEIFQIYTGQVANWSELGGDNLPIVCIGREAGSGTRDGFESITGTTDSCVYSQELTSTGDVVQTVSLNANAIGYASLESISSGVKLVSVEGVMPSNETILDGSYKIQRDFLLVTLKDAELTSEVTDFYNFMMSSMADEYIIKAGAVPVAK